MSSYPSVVSPAERPLRVIHSGTWVRLEPLSSEHVQELWPVARDEAESWAQLPLGPFAQPEDFRSCVKFMRASQAEIVWAVRPNDAGGESGTAAGWLALLDIQPAHSTIELGNVWFPRGLTRTRAASEAMFLLLAHAFDDLGYQRVAWKCDPAHRASRRAAERLGFHLRAF